MSQRILIIGAGRFGTHLASRLSEYGCDVCVVDNNPDRIEDLVQHGFHAVEIDAEDQDALKEAGAQEADAVVVSIGENMQGSILTTLLLKELKAKKIICRALDSRHATVLEKVGADLVLLPSRDMAYRLAERLRDNTQGDRQELCENYQLAQIRLGLALHGQSLEKARLRETQGINVVLVSRPRHGGKTEALEPKPSLVLNKDDLLFISGRRDKINAFEKECGCND